MGGKDRSRRALPVVAGVVGLVVGVVATWTVAWLGAEEPNPVVNADSADEGLVSAAVDAWRARPATERPRGAITVVHTGSTGARDVLVLLDETGLGSAYSRPAGSETGELRWVTTIGAPADGGEPARLTARSLYVGPAEIWVDRHTPGAELRAAVLTADEVRWQPVRATGGVALDVPEVGPDGCGLRIIAERRGDDSLVHAVWPESTPVGAQLRGDIEPLDPAGRRPAGDSARPRQADLDAAQLRLLSRLACVQAPETREPRTAVWGVTELWRGELPAGGPASLFTLNGGDRDLLLFSTDQPDPGGSVLRRDVPRPLWRNAAVASWFDRTDPAEDGPYRHWIVVAGTQEVATIDVVLPDGRRVTGQGRYLAVDLEQFGIDGTTAYQVTATDHEGNPVTVL